MKPKLHPSLKVANTVLCHIDLSAPLAAQCDVLCYENGREHGLAVRWLGEGGRSCLVCFAECRNSDQIVVYAGSTLQFDSGGNIPNEDVYGAAKYFDCGQFTRAAQFIERIIVAAAKCPA